jgi:hypothetical protein
MIVMMEANPVQIVSVASADIDGEEKRPEGNQGKG